MSNFEREKGKRGEREAAREMSRILEVPVRRSQQFKGTPESADLAGLDGLHFEVKRTERLSLYAALEQAAADCGDDLPVVLHRRNGKPWIIVHYLNDILDVSNIVWRPSDGSK